MRTQGAKLLLAAVLLGCSTGEGLSFDQFVNTTVELRRAADDTRTPAEYAARKQAIQQRLHVSDAELRQYVDSHRSDVRVLSAAWDSVEARLGRANAKEAAARPRVRPQPTTPPAGPAPVIPPQVGPDARGSATVAPSASPATVPPGTLPPPQMRPDRPKAVRF